MHTTVFRPHRPPTKPKRQAWKRRLIALVLLVVMGYVGFVSWLMPIHAIAGETKFGATIGNEDVIPLDWPSYGQAAIGANDYGVLASHGNPTSLPTASVAKTITALAVLSKHPLKPDETGPTLTMTQTDLDRYYDYLARHGSIISVRVGQKLTQRQALEAILLKSANNMADTVAVWAFGSLAAYQKYANNFVDELGLTNTTVGADASGLDPGTTSTATDLVRLGEIVMDNAVLAKIVGQKTAEIPDVGTIHSTNNLLGKHGIIGVKTGTDYQNKGVYLFAANYKVPGGQTVQIIGAVMGAPSIDQAKQDAVNLLASAKAGFGTRTLFQAGEVVGRYTPTWSNAAVTAKVTKDVSVLGWRGQPLNVSVSLENITPPARAGDTVGQITVNKNGVQKVIGTVELSQTIESPSWWWRMTHPNQPAQFDQNTATID